MKVKIITMLISIGIMGVFIPGVTTRIETENLQRKLAEEIFRFHVLANSDSEEDQNLKMEVKDHIVNYMKLKIPAAKNREETKKWAETHLSEIEEEALSIVRRNGYDYDVNAEVTKSMFPEKTYGDLTFPEGIYETLRISIGKGRGRNWWCVLYPNLCFLDCVHAVVPEEGKEKLKEKLTVDEYDMITAYHTFKVKCFFFGKK